MKDISTRKPALFFDRDGTLNEDYGYVAKWKDFKWIRGAISSIRLVNNSGYLVFVVTNQSGIARGFHTEEDVEILHHKMNADLGRHGAHIDGFYYCPHHPQGSVKEYTVTCYCRKPGAGMLYQAMSEWPIKTNRSYFVGDKGSDIEAAEAAGIKGVIFKEKNLFNFVRKLLASEKPE